MYAYMFCIKWEKRITKNLHYNFRLTLLWSAYPVYSKAVYSVNTVGEGGGRKFVVPYKLWLCCWNSFRVVFVHLYLYGVYFRHFFLLAYKRKNMKYHMNIPQCEQVAFQFRATTFDGLYDSKTEFFICLTNWKSDKQNVSRSTDCKFHRVTEESFFFMVHTSAPSR
jgi:hypothetical protein